MPPTRETLEGLGISVEIKPDVSGSAVVDRALKGNEATAKATNAAIAKASREAAAAQKRHEREIAAEAKAAAAAGRAAKRAVAEEARKSQAAERALAKDIAATTRAYQQQAAAADAAFAKLSRANRGPRKLGDDLGAYGRARPGVGQESLLAGGAARLALAAGATLSATEAMGLADAYAAASSQLRTMHGQTEAQVIAQRELFAVAQDTASEFGSVVGLYRQIGKAVTDMHGSQADAIGVVETLTKAIKASGSAGASADAAMVQLSQGLAAGALRGEEFNSVIEQAPVIIDLIAAHMGKTRGEMRAMAADGKLTSRVIIDALKSQETQQKVNEQYAQRLETFSDQWVRFRNEASKALSELASRTDAVETLGNVLGGVTEALRGIVDMAGLAAKAVGALGDISIGGYQLDTGAVGSVIKGAVKYGIPVYGQALAVRDAYGALTDRDPSLGEQISLLQDLRKHTEGMKGILGEIARDTDNLPGMAGFIIRLQERGAVQKFVAEQRAAALIPIATRALIEGVGTGAKSRQAQEKRDKEASDARKRLREEYDRFGASLSSVEAAEIELSQAEDLLQRAVRAGFATQETAIEQLERKRDLLRDSLDPFGAVVREIERETVLLGVDAKARERTVRLLSIENDLRSKGVELSDEQWASLTRLLDAQDAAAKADEKRTQALDAQRQIYDMVHGPAIRFAELMAAARAEASRGALTLDEYRGVVAKLREEFASSGNTDPLTESWRRQIEEMEKAKEVSAEIRESFVDTFSELGRGLLDLANTGKGSFEDLAENAIQAIHRILIQMALLEGAKAIFGGNSGAFDIASQFIGGIFGGSRAGGGTYMVPGSGGVDSRNVLFRVTPGERITFTPPGQMAPSGGAGAAGGAPNVNVPVQVVNVFDPQKAALAAMSGPEGARVIMNLIDTHADAIAARIRAAT